MSEIFKTLFNSVFLQSGQEASLETAQLQKETTKYVGPVASSGYSKKEGRYRMKGLNDTYQLIIPPEFAKRFAIWCPYEGDSEKTIELLKTIMGEEATAMETQEEQNQTLTPAEAKRIRSEKEFRRIFARALQLTNNPKNSWCKVSVAQSNPWYGGNDAQLDTPALVLSKGFWKSFLSTNSQAYSETPKFCEEHNSWVNSMQTAVPQEVEAMILREWEKNGGRNWPEDKNKEFMAALNLCLTAFNIKALPGDIYDISLDPKSLCVSAMDIAVPKKKGEETSTMMASTSWYGQFSDTREKATPKEALENFMDLYLLKMPWVSWVQRYTFCDPVVNRSVIEKIWGNILTKLVAAYAFLTVAVSFIARALGTSLSLWGAAKAIPQFWKWGPKGLDKFKEWREKRKGGRKDPPSGAAPATSGAAAGAGASSGAKKPDPKEGKAGYSPLVDPDTVTKATLGVMVLYAAYKVGELGLKFGRFANPAAAFIPANTETIKELGNSVDCGFFDGDSVDCASWRARQKRRAFNKKMLRGR